MDKNIDFILASKSARRREILEAAGYNFIIMEAKDELNIIGEEYNEDLVLKCAEEKAKSVYNEIKDDEELKNKVIVASDTIVVINNTIIGKPKDREDAHRILSSLSGTTHFVETAVSICKGGNVLNGKDRTYITFRKLTDKEIYDYIENFPPYDKAGGYGIQDPGNDFHTKIDGDLDTVLGFSMKVFYELYKKIKE